MPGQLIRETNPAQGYGPALVPQHEDVNGDYKTTGEKNPLPVSVEDGGAAAQVDIQYRKQKTIQSHSGVSVLASAWSGSAWIDTDGYNEIGVTFLNDAATNNAIAVEWSNDGVTKHGTETIAAAGTSKERAGSLTTKSRWAKVALNNLDTVPHTMNAWLYLKV